MIAPYLIGFLLGIAFSFLVAATLIRWSRWMEECEMEQRQAQCSHWEQSGPCCTRCGKRLAEEQA